MTADERHSVPLEAELASDPDEIARLEARNALRQFDTMIELVNGWTGSPDREFRLRPSTILQLHRLALEGLSRYAGNWRPAGVTIGGSLHKPPEAFLVAELVEDLCDYINENWSKRSAIHLAAYVLWRLNWIHPFDDGNGRTSRAVSYLALCVRLGYRLPGTETIPELIAMEKQPYYDALEAADAGDLGTLEKLLETHLARQLLGVVTSAVASPGPDGSSSGPHLH